MSFFLDDLKVPPPSFKEYHKFILRFPPLLYLDLDVFLRPNKDILKKYFELDDILFSKLIICFPQLLGYNPITLEKMCKQSIYFLTSDSDYLVTDVDDLQAESSDNNINLFGNGLLGVDSFDMDLLSDLVGDCDLNSKEGKAAVKILMEMGISLRLEKGRALNSIRLL
jgi:hypothetical protein